MNDLVEATDQKLAAYAATVAERNSSRAEAFSASYNRVHNSCCGTYQQRFQNCENNTDWQLYDSIDELNAYIFLGSYLFKYCDLVNHLVESVISYVIGGNEIKYTIVPKVTACALPEAPQTMATLQCIVDRITSRPEWMTVYHRDLLHRQHITGDVLRRVKYLDDRVESIYTEPFQLTNQIPDEQTGTEPVTGIEFKDLSARAPFGVVFAAERILLGNKTLLREDVTKPVAYVAEERFLNESDMSDEIVGQVYPAVEMQHLKFGVDSQMPRGVTPWFRTFDSSEGKSEVLVSARKLMLRRAENSVVEKVLTGASDESLQKMISSQKRAEKRRRENTGSEFGHGGRRVTRNVEIEFMNLQLGMADIIRLIEQDELRIGKQIQAPDFISHSRSDMGARATSDMSVRPWHARIRTTQKQVRDMNVDFLWKAIGWDLYRLREDPGFQRFDQERLKELQRFYEIQATGFSDPAQDVEGAHNRSIDRYDRNIDTKEQVAMAGGSVYEADKKCDELQETCDPLGDIVDTELTSEELVEVE